MSAEPESTTEALCPMCGEQLCGVQQQRPSQPVLTVLTVLTVLAELRQLGLARPEYNLASPYGRGT